MLDENMLSQFRHSHDVGIPSVNSPTVAYRASPLGCIILNLIEQELRLTPKPYGKFVMEFPEYAKGVEKIERWFIASGLDHKRAKPILRRMIAFIREKKGSEASFASIWGSLIEFPLWISNFFPSAKSALFRQSLISKLFS